MLLIIDYPDGTREALTAELVGGVVSHGRRWVLGILVQEPKHCYFKSDFFEAALNKGNQRSGEATPDAEDSEFMGFRWKLVDDEADACREKMAHWMTRLRSAFDPEVSGTEYLLEGLLRLLSEEEAVQYDRDRECWLTYLDDPASELTALSRRPGAALDGWSGREGHGSGPTYG